MPSRTAALAFMILLALLAPVAPCSAHGRTSSPDAEATTVILVRHTEKVTAKGDPDPPLSDLGRIRANLLATMLADAQLAAVYTTPFARTRDTAGPAALKHALTPVETPLSDDYFAGVAGQLRRDHPGETVLVVGHSNTTPGVLEALGCTPPDIPEHVYDDLFIATVWPEDRCRLVHLRYGAPTPR